MGTITRQKKKRQIVGIAAFIILFLWHLRPSNYIDHSPLEKETRSERVQHTSPPSERFADSRRCDLYRGKWIHDPVGPLYTNNSCTHITAHQNCQGNGRPDKDYENWRWKPHHCDLPRFNATKFLELMRGKTLAFIGDSVARNQMESLLCILSQVDRPRNRGSRSMQRHIFGSTSTTITRIWSSWLVNKTIEPHPSSPNEKLMKIHLDIPDEAFIKLLRKFDVLVLSSGHWFSNMYAYVLNGSIPKRKIYNVEAFNIAMETILTTVATLPDYNGLTVLRSYSPDHYHGGAWNTGGSCSKFDRPATELVSNEYTDVMHKKQVLGFKRATKKLSNGSKLRLMDVTELAGYRNDGHPGQYRSTGSDNTETKGSGRGKSPSKKQDCLHWCMPGPVDTWNEILFEIMKRDL